MNLQYVTGDATDPQGYDDENKVIVHCCNDIGAWGAGFVLALSKRWPKTKIRYQAMFLDKSPRPRLGDIQWVYVAERTWVVNLIGQKDTGIKHFDEKPLIPVRYGAIYEGFLRIRQALSGTGNPSAYSIHMPRIGCGLAGGKWENMEGCIEAAFGDMDIDITVYDFGG